VSSDPSIGLQRGTVRVVEYDPRWAFEFEAEAQRVAAVLSSRDLPPVEFEHVGSTAVPGLAAKPIIDFMVGLAPGADRRVFIEAFVAAGYELRGPQGVPERELLVLGPESRRTHHLNLVEFDGAFWRDHLAFRERLRNDAELRAEYSALKRLLADRHPLERAAYTNGKASFIQSVLEDISRH